MPIGLGMIEGAVGVIGGIFNLANPNDERRMREADSLAQAALAGDRYSYVKLWCLSGDQAARAEATQLGFIKPTDRECGYATKRAREYATALLFDVNSKMKLASGSADVTRGSYAIGTRTAPATYFAGLGAGTSPLVMFGIAAAVIYLLTKKG